VRWIIIKRLKKLVENAEAKICSVAVAVAVISPKCCRGIWYQPEEPRKLNALLQDRIEEKMDSISK
jgi:cyclic lactone autoinducer peptide